MLFVGFRLPGFKARLEGVSGGIKAYVYDETLRENALLSFGIGRLFQGCACCSIAFTSASISFDWDTSPTKRKGTPNLTDVLPSEKNNDKKRIFLGDRISPFVQLPFFHAM